MPIPHSCLTCSKTFTTLSGLRSHSKAKGHIGNPFFCDTCDLSFQSPSALSSHMNSPKHVDDETPAAFLDGRDDSDAESDSSDRRDDSDAESDSTDDDPYCYGCSRQFVDMAALNQHLLDSAKHNWCFECSRDFGSENALLNHQNSLAHRERDFTCPFCQQRFKSPSGIALHIESGCHKKITRHHVTAAIQTMDIVPNITIKRITGSVPPPTVRTYIATVASFNGSAYECYLCRKTFRTLPGLNGHLNSPAHDDDEFRCPKCKTEFKLISGFVQHLETGSCGLAATSQINNYFNDLTAQFSRLLKF